MSAAQEEQLKGHEGFSEKAYKDTKDILGDVYGVTGGIEEFIAEAFSNAAFRRRLAGINIKGEELNLLQKFTNAARRVLNAILKRTGFESRTPASPWPRGRRWSAPLRCAVRIWL